MRTLGVTRLRLAPGDVGIGFDFNANFTRQNGFLHAGVTAARVDTAPTIRDRMENLTYTYNPFLWAKHAPRREAARRMP